MIVAQVVVTAGGRRGIQLARHIVAFADVGKARGEYERVVDLLKKRAEKKNDLSQLVEIDGASGSRVTVPLDEIQSVALWDFALANTHEAGVANAFPHLFKGR